MSIKKGFYKDIEGVILENELLRVAVLPSIGSKTASLVYKPLEYETLWQNPDKFYRKTGYGASYGEGEFSGFDEMFPAISRCFYEDPPWEGTEVPDHGEVWALPWTEKIEQDTLVMKVRGVRFPYCLKKRVFIEGSVFRIDYFLENYGPVEFHYIWAAHPLFNTCPGMEFIVPEGMNRIFNSVPGRRLGRYGREISFPMSTDYQGNSFDLSKVPEKNTFGYQKYFFTDKVPEGRCSLRNPENGLDITLSFPETQVPYLGMWLNEGGWEGQYNIAPEPATAAMDRIDFSRMWNMGSSIGPYEKKSWYFEIKCSMA